MSDQGVEGVDLQSNGVTMSYQSELMACVLAGLLLALADHAFAVVEAPRNQVSTVGWHNRSDLDCSHCR